MLSFIKKLFAGKPAVVEAPAEVAPYKVEVAQVAEVKAAPVVAPKKAPAKKAKAPAKLTAAKKPRKTKTSK